MELDATFVRATKLLLCNSKDSEEQLRSLLEDVIKQRHPNKTLGNIPIKKEERAPKRESSKSSHKGSEKRNYEKAFLDENSDVRAAPAKVKTPEGAKTVAPPAPVQPPRAVVTSQSRGRDDDDRGYGLEISLEDDLSCTICGGMEVGVGNHLVECLECHTLYHQECHSPTILESDFNDPRSAWYCGSCSRETANSSSSAATTKTAVKMAAKPSGKYDAVQAQNLFKRNECKVVGSGLSGGKSGSPGSAAMGMAGLAASLQPPSATQSAGKPFGGSSVSKSSTPGGGRDSKPPPPPSTAGKSAAPNPNIVDKRLFIMKKRAAKMQEQRKHIK